MAVRRLDQDQPRDFAFSPENLAWARATITKYPEGKQASAVIPLLWRAQEQSGNWLPEPAIRYIADMLAMAEIRVLEVATFYTMFQLSPVGSRAHIQVCGTTPCMLRGAEDLVALCKRRIHAKPHHLSKDGDFSWEEVECLGACVNAPLVQVDKDVYEDLTPIGLENLLDAFARGERPDRGPQTDRQFSAPLGGPTTLTDAGLYEPKKPNGAAGLQMAAPQATPQATPAATTMLSGPPPAGSPPAPVGSLAPPTPEMPGALPGPRGGKADDLKLINGVGPKLEGVLNELGVFHYEQIANWTPSTVAWVDERLSFKGRIDREDWISQAIRLLERNG